MKPFRDWDEKLVKKFFIVLADDYFVVALGGLVSSGSPGAGSPVCSPSRPLRMMGALAPVLGRREVLEEGFSVGFCSTPPGNRFPPPVEVDAVSSICSQSFPPLGGSTQHM